LQELYINPHKLNMANWDCLAAAIKWSRENADIMADTHWVGGNPSAGDIYGFASWSPKKAILTLRNPSNTTKSFVIDTRKVFELPPNSKSRYQFFNAIPNTKVSAVPFFAGENYTVTLKPFQVMVLNAVPVL
jgi:hypothetical protein